MINFIPTTKGAADVRAAMHSHYSQPKGFVGRQLLYRIEVDGVVYGFIGWGSATRHLPGRTFPVTTINHGLNNTFFHIGKVNDRYPCRNFTTRVVLENEPIAVADYQKKYHDAVWWLETLVEIPRTGELYTRAGYQEVGLTKGFTCKRVAGPSSDGWTGKRVWNTTTLRPKRVFIKTL